MKKLRFVFLIVFIFGFLLLLTSCTCDPSEHMWYIERFEQNTVYLNGVEATEIYNKSPMLEKPFGGMENGVVSIVFQKDGSVIFTPGTGEILNGKYTLKNNGMADTSFTVALDNGESFSGIAVAYYYGRDLKFEFRGMSYWFEEEYHTADVLYEEKMEQFKTLLRYDAENDRLNKGTIERVFDRYELKTEEGTVVALDDSVAIQCVSMDKDNNIENLNKILTGECFYVTSKTYDGKDKIVIYYIEVPPKEPDLQPEPEPIYLSDFRQLQWLKNITADEISQIKMTHTFKNLPSGYCDYHDYISDKDKIEDIISILRNIEMIEAPKEEFETNYSQELITIRIYSGSYEHVIEYNGGYFKRAEYDYWKFKGDFPEFSYKNAVRTFIVSEDDKPTIYHNGDYYSIHTNLTDIEFIVDPEEYDYRPKSEWIIVCDFGEIVIFDETHFRYNGENYLITSEYNFAFAEVPS